jgi:hypothetical protein
LHVSNIRYYRFKVCTEESRPERRERTEWKRRCGLRLSALMELYIHHLKGLVIEILSFIPNSSASIHPLYHLYPLWGLLVTLSKYIHVTFCFKLFIATNLIVQSEFNLIFLVYEL